MGLRRSSPTWPYSFKNLEIRQGYLVAPAFLAVESRSTGQRLKALLDKCRLDHHRMGRPYCWVIDAEEECACECHQGMNGMHRRTGTTQRPKSARSTPE
jgi:Uma2 family endonuclease